MENITNFLKANFPSASPIEKIDLLTQGIALKKLSEDDQLPEEAKLSYVVKQIYLIEDSLKNALATIYEHYPILKDTFTLLTVFKGEERNLINFLLEVSRMNLNKDNDPLNDLLMSTSKAEGEFTTSNTLNELLIKLLEPKSGSLYDATVGFGGTLLEAHKTKENLSLYGEDINETAVRIAKLRLFINGNETAQIHQADIFNQPTFTEKDHLQQFDFVAMHMPFGLRLHSTDAFKNDKYHRFLYGKLTQTNVDLAFLMHGISTLNERGQGAFLMMGSPLMRGGADKSVRENLITADLIEAVIALPEKMLLNTTIPTYIIIINKDKTDDMKQKIMFINASHEYEQKRFYNYLSNEQIEKIIKTYKNKNQLEDYSTIIANSDLEDAILLPEKYIVDKTVDNEKFGSVRIRHNKLKENKKAVKLKDCVETIYRGLNITASTVKEGSGPLKIIKLSDVENGYVHLNHLTKGELVRDSNLARYRVKKGDLIISNRGTHTKIAVIPEVDDNVILSHSFIGLRLKEEIDPYYLKMYLESPIGQFEISQQQVGSKILSISPANLEKINVLLPQANDLGLKYDAIYQQYEQALKEIEAKQKEAIKQLYKESGLFDYMKLEN